MAGQDPAICRSLGHILVLRDHREKAQSHDRFEQQGSEKGPSVVVLIADRLADRVISIGGMLVIGAVLGIMVFLVYEVIPLVKGGSVESRAEYSWAGAHAPILD